MYILRGESCAFLRNTSKKVVLSDKSGKFGSLALRICGCHNRHKSGNVAGVALVAAVFHNRENHSFVLYGASAFNGSHIYNAPFFQKPWLCRDRRF